MFDAYVSLLYNIGLTKANKDWKVFQYIRDEKYELAAPEFLNINKEKIGGDYIVINGLTNRRKAEFELFMNGKY